MTNDEILGYIDHTLLKMTSSLEEMTILCDEALKFRTASVCIPPCYVKTVRNEYSNLNICTVIGFPLGYSITEAKILEAERAVLSGANEIDMVINVCDVKNNRFDSILEEIETCYLTTNEKIRMCEIVTEAGAGFIKTSTGFGTAGAALADIELFKKHIGPDVKIKAAGGIKTREDLITFINAGVTRIGTSSAVKLLSGGSAGDY
jgi:deoxyribose-phosphate aldolase